MKTHLLTLCAALILLPTTALAAPARNDEGALVSEKDGVRVLIIEDSDTVDGEVLKPDGFQVNSRIAEDHANLIGIRGHFRDYLIRLSNDI